MNDAELARLIEGSRPLVSRVARQYFTSREDVEDATQKSLVNMWQFRDQWDQSESPDMAKWAGRVAQNACRDMLRWRNRRIQTASFEALTPEDWEGESSVMESIADESSLRAFEPDSEDQGQSEWSARLASVLAQVGPTHARVLKLWSENSTNREIAEELGIKLNTARSTSYRARERARALAAV